MGQREILGERKGPREEEGLPISTFTVDHEAVLPTVGGSANNRAPTPCLKGAMHESKTSAHEKNG